MAVPLAIDVESRMLAARSELDRLVRTESGGAERVRETFPDVWNDEDSAVELIYAEFVQRRQLGQSPNPDEWRSRWPQWSDRLDRLFALSELLTPDAVEVRDHPPGYELLDEIGRGSTAAVYRARQKDLNRIVALKVLRDDRRVLQEAELAARLQHPNIVQIYEIGEWNDGPFLALEYLGGGSLAEKWSVASGQWSVKTRNQEAARIIETLARAIHYAHGQGVVHRDLKPANVLVGVSSNSSQTTDHWPLTTFKIADFGLAIPFGSAQQVSQSLSLAGTPCYMAPEQAEAKSDIGPPADIHALGAILYELLSGRPPFVADSVPATLDLVRQAEPKPLTGVSPDLQTICLKCLRKPPSDRYRTALDLADDLRRFLEGRPVQARPVSFVERGVKWVRRRPALAGLAAALSVAMIAGGIIQNQRIRDRQTAREAEQQLELDAQVNRAKRLVATARAAFVAGKIDEAKSALNECPESLRDADWKKLHRMCHAEIASWSGREVGGGFNLAVSRDGRHLACVSYVTPRRINVLDALTGKVRGTVPTFAAGQLVEFTADSRHLVVVLPMEGDQPRRTTITANIGEVRYDVLIWDIESNRQTNRWSFQSSGAPSLSSTGRFIATGDVNQVRAWESTTGEMFTTIPGPDEAVTRFSFSWDNLDRRLAIRMPSKTIIWDTEKNRSIAVLPQAARITGTNVLRPDGTMLATPIANPHKSILIRRVDDGTTALDVPTAESPMHLTFSADSRRMAFRQDRKIDLHDAQTGAHLATLSGHEHTIFAIRFSPDGRRIYSLSLDKTLRTWDISPWIGENP